MEKKKNSTSLKITGIKDSCTGCGACANICPASAITLDYDDEGFYHPVVDLDVCVRCMKCERHCHVLTLDDTNDQASFTPYMCWAKEEKLRSKSSSGGVFSLLADIVLSEGGVVFGARYNFEKERLEHNHTDNYDLSEFRKSKYIESAILKTFSEVKQFLGAGRFVLYCGTPCQIVGLKVFLAGVDVSKLLLIDFVCHGVPSNKHFTEYKHYVETKKKDEVVGFDFRPKDSFRGWKTCNIKIDFFKTSALNELYRENLYYTAFQENLLLRRSCYSCNLLNSHQSDITIGDFWGIRRHKPELDDDKGISLSILNTPKGEFFFDNIKLPTFKEKLPFSAVEYIYAKRDSEKVGLKLREVIAPAVITKGYITVMRKRYSKEICVWKIKISVKRILKRMLGKI